MVDYEYLSGDETLPELLKRIAGYYGQDTLDPFFQAMQKYMQYLPKKRQKELIEGFLPDPLKDIDEQVKGISNLGGKTFYVPLSDLKQEDRKIYNECLSYYRKKYNPKYLIDFEDE